MKDLNKNEKELLRGIRHSSIPCLFFDSYYHGYETQVMLKRMRDYKKISIYLQDQQRREIFDYYQRLFQQETDKQKQSKYQNLYRCVKNRNHEAEKAAKFQQVKEAKAQMDQEIAKPRQRPKQPQQIPEQIPLCIKIMRFLQWITATIYRKLTSSRIVMNQDPNIFGILREKFEMRLQKQAIFKSSPQECTKIESKQQQNNSMQ